MLGVRSIRIWCWFVIVVVAQSWLSPIQQQCSLVVLSSVNSSKVYVLRLEQGKYYVGMSTHPLQRFAAHQSGTASAWTRKYKPVNLIQVMETDNALLKEDSTTLLYMNQYGIENVRGGPYTKLVLTAKEIDSIQQRLRHMNNVCLLCGSSAHFAGNCPNKPNIHKVPNVI
jgi:GIY-YIG catalytic domain